MWAPQGLQAHPGAGPTLGEVCTGWMRVLLGVFGALRPGHRQKGVVGRTVCKTRVFFLLFRGSILLEAWVSSILRGPPGSDLMASLSTSRGCWNLRGWFWLHWAVWSEHSPLLRVRSLRPALATAPGHGVCTEFSPLNSGTVSSHEPS